MTIPIISGLSIKLHALENWRGLNFQFDIAVVYALSKNSIEFFFLNQETLNVLLLVFSRI